MFWPLKHSFKLVAQRASFFCLVGRPCLPGAGPRAVLGSLPQRGANLPLKTEGSAALLARFGGLRFHQNGTGSPSMSVQPSLETVPIFFGASFGLREPEKNLPFFPSLTHALR